MSKTNKMLFNTKWQDKQFTLAIDTDHVIAPKPEDPNTIFNLDGTFKNEDMPVIIFYLQCNDHGILTDLVIEYSGGVDLDSLDSFVSDLEDSEYVDDVALESDDRKLYVYCGEGLNHEVINMLLTFCYSYFGHLELYNMDNSMPKVKWEVKEDFYLHNMNLKDRKFDLVQQINDEKGNAYVIGNFGEDINGLSLDGKFSKRCCAIIPVNKVRQVKENKEDKKEEIKKSKNVYLEKRKLI